MGSADTARRVEQPFNGRGSGKVPAFPPPARSFLSGMASVLNIFGTPRYFYSYRSPKLSDREAIRSDWEAVGADLRNSMEKFEAEHAEAFAGQQRLFSPEELD